MSTQAFRGWLLQERDDELKVLWSTIPPVKKTSTGCRGKDSQFIPGRHYRPPGAAELSEATAAERSTGTGHTLQEESHRTTPRTEGGKNLRCHSRADICIPITTSWDKCVVKSKLLEQPLSINNCKTIAWHGIA